MFTLGIFSDGTAGTPGDTARHVRPVLGRAPLAALDALACRRPVQMLVEKKKQRSAAVVLSLLKQLPTFGYEIGALDHNPAQSSAPRHSGDAQALADR